MCVWMCGHTYSHAQALRSQCHPLPKQEEEHIWEGRGRWRHRPPTHRACQGESDARHDPVMAVVPAPAARLRRGVTGEEGSCMADEGRDMGQHIDAYSHDRMHEHPRTRGSRYTGTLNPEGMLGYGA